MNRVIRFRAWDGDTKTMYADVGVYRNRITARDDESLILGRNDYPLMQFTGVHDKHGKEIYEGDVLEYRNGKRFTVKDIVPYYVSHPGAYLSMSFCKNSAEVIGNIWEHPNLARI